MKLLEKPVLAALAAFADKTPDQPQPHWRGRAATRRWAAALAGVVLGAFGAGEAPAQNIFATVAVNDNSTNFVDIQNTSGGDWYFYTDPTPAAATMSRISDDGVEEYPWGSVGNFAPDPGDYEYDRIYADEFLRVYPNTVAAGTVIKVAYATTPLGTQYDFEVTVSAGAQVTAITLLDPSPTVAASVQWGVSFDQAISGVTAANFAFDNPDGMTGIAITGVTPDTAEPSTNWTVTASTGSGTGLLGLNWAGTQSETPPVVAPFVGPDYTFSTYPLITEEPANAGINVNSSATLTVAAVLRGGGAVTYQWYSGTSVDPDSATAITGATGSSYTTPTFTSAGSHEYFCRVTSTPGTYTDSTTAIITVVEPPSIETEPANTIVALGHPATLTVVATGTSLNYQWYQGVPPVPVSTPVGENSASFTTNLTEDSTFWVQISNPGPTIANSVVAKVTVLASLTAGASGYSASIGGSYSPLPSVTARDTGNNLVSSVPVTFTLPAAGNGVPGASFAGNALTATASTGAGGVASVPALTANTNAGVFTIVANFSTLSVNLSATNFPVFSSAGAAIFLTQLTNSYAMAELGYAAPDFTFAGSLPGGVALSTAGVLSGDPPAGSGGVYPLSISVNGGGTSPAATQPFTLTVLEKNVLAARTTFETNGVAWALNGDHVNGGPVISNNAIVLTDLAVGENRSAWFRYPLYVGAFEADFDYIDIHGQGADGVAFVVQNDPRGTSALGLNGGGLGYCDISNSAAILLNLYGGSPGGPSGIMLGTNGVGVYNAADQLSGRSYTSTSPVNVDSGDLIHVHLNYVGNILTATLTDSSAGVTYQTEYEVDIPDLVGTDTAYVGITGSEGGVQSAQTVSNFEYVPVPPLTVSGAAPGNLVLSWPESVVGFQPQYNADLNSTNWQVLTTAIIQTNGQNQVAVPATEASGFYRLVLP